MQDLNSLVTKIVQTETETNDIRLYQILFICAFADKYTT